MNALAQVNADIDREFGIYAATMYESEYVRLRGGTTVSVIGSPACAGTRGNVSVSIEGNAMTFEADMGPDDARQLAGYLIAAADRAGMRT